jgi:hypothetical protein
MRLTRIVLLRIEELSPRMGPTGYFENPVVGAQVDRVVARIGIGVQVAAVVFQESLRTVPAAAERKVVDRLGMAVVAHIGPEAALAAAVLSANQHGDLGVVRPEYWALNDQLPLQLVERLKQISPGPAIPRAIGRSGGGLHERQAMRR